jgi:predicted ArsR family transcriptional regulator
MRTYALPKSERNHTCRRIVKHLPNTAAKLAEVLKLRKGTVVCGLRVLKDEKLIHIGAYEVAVGVLRPVYHLSKRRNANRPNAELAIAKSKDKYFEKNKETIYAKRKAAPRTASGRADERVRAAKYRAANRDLINAKAIDKKRIAKLLNVV